VPVTRRSTTKKARAAAPVVMRDADLPAFVLERRAPRPQAAIPRHRFRVGQRLRLVIAGAATGRAAGTCRVIALMPPERGVFNYRVRNEVENFERIVPEADLAALETQLP
jgi:hypothetical protein